MRRGLLVCTSVVLLLGMSFAVAVNPKKNKIKQVNLKHTVAEGLSIETRVSNGVERILVHNGEVQLVQVRDLSYPAISQTITTVGNEITLELAMPTNAQGETAENSCQGYMCYHVSLTTERCTLECCWGSVLCYCEECEVVGFTSQQQDVLTIGPYVPSE